jgi:charged multivesicular body protein 6
MGNLFGKPKGGKITEVDKALLALRTQRRKLTAERKRVEGVIAREVAIARELIPQQKRDRALLALKKKKLQEGQLANLDSWLLNVEEVLGNIDAAKRQNRVFEGLKQGHAALKQLQQEVTLQDAEKLMDDSAEAKEYQERMSDVLQQSLTPEQDEAAVQELQAMEAETAYQEVEEQLPAVPQTQIQATEQQSEQALPDVPSKLSEPVEQLRSQAAAQGRPVAAAEELVPA